MASASRRTRRRTSGPPRDPRCRARPATPGQQRSGASFADACADFLQWIEHDRGRKRSTLNDYGSAVRAHLLPAFGHLPLEGVDRAAIDRWRTALVAAKRLSPRSVNKLLTILHGIFERAR